MKKWIAFLKESCSDSQNPLEAQQFFGQFRKRFNSVASKIQDTCCKNALDNLFKTIQTRILYLKNMPEHDAYTAFAERFAAAKAAEKLFPDDTILDEDIIIENEKVDVEEHVSDGAEEMDIDAAQKSLDELNVVAEEEIVAQKEEEDTVDMKAWMANQ